MKPLLTVAELLAWCSRAPTGTHIPAAEIAAILAADTPSVAHGPPGPEVSNALGTWREKLWTVSGDVRLGVREVAECLGRPVSFVYSRTKGRDVIPHRRLDGRLVFTAGEVRAWIRSREEVITAGPGDTRTLSINR